MIVKSPFADVEIPDMPFTAFLFQNVKEHPNKPALIEGLTGRIITYQQLLNAIQHVASGLHQRGFSKGDVFAICSPNLPEYAIVFHAIASLGGIVTTINPLYTADEIANQLNDCKARFLLTIPSFLEKAQIAQAKSAIEEIFVFGDAEGATSFAQLLQNDGKSPDVYINPAEDLIVLPYSSGTTGLPKGVMLTHRNLVANVLQMDANIGFSKDDTTIGILPFYHIYGMVVVMSYMLYLGGTVVTMPQFDLENFLRILQTYKVTRACIVPPIILALAKHPLVDQFDLSHLKHIFSGAAPLSADLQSAAAQRLGCTVVQGYGLTETSPVTHATPDNPNQIKIGSVGPSLPNTEVKIVSIENKSDLNIGEEGEVWIRGPQVMKGYLNNPTATAQMIDSEGWLHTGDIGYIDEDGYLFVVDRVKELIKYKGMQVAPAELEGVLLRHEAIADVAVIGIRDEEAGELPKAFVVLKAGVTLTIEEVITFVAGQVAPHKKVRQVEFVTQIPKSASGKILRRILVEQERNKQA